MGYGLKANRRGPNTRSTHSAQFSLKVGTIFEDSPIGLEKWLPALWLLTNCKNGISSYELARALGVTQKPRGSCCRVSVWLLQGKVAARCPATLKSMKPSSAAKLATCTRPSASACPSLRRPPMIGKVAVMGLLARHPANGTAQVRLRGHRDNRKRHDQAARHRRTRRSRFDHAHRRAESSYQQPDHEYVHHNVIDHAERYVDGTVHTNGMENFWSLLKRLSRAPTCRVEPFHLFRYLDEQVVPFQPAQGSDAMRFTFALKGILNKRLTYSALTGSELPQTCYGPRATGDGRAPRDTCSSTSAQLRTQHGAVHVRARDTRPSPRRGPLDTSAL